MESFAQNSDIRSKTVMESRDLVSVSRRVSRPVFWSLGLGLGLSLEGLRSRLGLGLGLELLDSRLCIGYFFMNFCKKELLKKRF